MQGEILFQAIFKERQGDEQEARGGKEKAMIEGRGCGRINRAISPVSPIVDRSLMMRWNSPADILTVAL